MQFWKTKNKVAKFADFTKSQYSQIKDEVVEAFLRNTAV